MASAELLIVYPLARQAGPGNRILQSFDKGCADLKYLLAFGSMICYIWAKADYGASTQL